MFLLLFLSHLISTDKIWIAVIGDREQFKDKMLVDNEETNVFITIYIYTKSGRYCVISGGMGWECDNLDK